MIVTTLAISSANRTLIAGPVVEPRGFVDPNGSTGLLAKLQNRAIDAALTELDAFTGEDASVAQAVKRAIRRSIGSTVHRETRRKPVLQITVLDADSAGRTLTIVFR